MRTEQFCVIFVVVRAKISENVWEEIANNKVEKKTLREKYNLYWFWKCVTGHWNEIKHEMKWIFRMSFV